MFNSPAFVRGGVPGQGAPICFGCEKQGELYTVGEYVKIAVIAKYISSGRCAMNEILIVEDDAMIASGLCYALSQEGFETKSASSCACFREIYRPGVFTMAILDLTLPDGTGYDLCKHIKQLEDIPILFLTACDDEVSVVMGLDMGADDYITKPFRIRELCSRIKTILRRYGRQAGDDKIFCTGNVCVDLKKARVTKCGRDIDLTAMEYRLLLTLINNRGQVLSRNQLLEGIWDVAGDFVNDNTLTVYIKRIREKLEDDPARPVLIKTVRGLGYCLEV